MLGDDLDVKPKEASSPSSESKVSVLSKTGIEDDSKTAEQEVEKPGETLDEFLDKTLDSKPTEDDDSEAEAEKPLDSKSESDEGKKKETEEEKDPSEVKDEEKEKSEVEAKVEDLPEGKPVPYERFKEVLTERNQTKQQYAEVEQEVKTYRGVVKFCNENNITDQQYTTAMEIQAAINKGDVKTALAKLSPIVESLKLATGDKLPEDIQKWVDDGGDLDMAKKWAADRGGRQINENMHKVNAERQQKAESAKFTDECVKASDTWLIDRVKTDPDFKPKAKESDVNGKFELVNMAYIGMLNERLPNGKFKYPVSKPADMAALLDKAYASVDGVFKTTFARTRTPTSKRLPTAGSTKSAKSQSLESALAGATSMEEAVGLMLDNRG